MQLFLKNTTTLFGKLSRCFHLSTVAHKYHGKSLKSILHNQQNLRRYLFFICYLSFRQASLTKKNCEPVGKRLLAPWQNFEKATAEVFASLEFQHEALGQFPGMVEAPSNSTSRYRTLCWTWTRAVETECDNREQLSLRFIFPRRERVYVTSVTTSIVKLSYFSRCALHHNLE